MRRWVGIFLIPVLLAGCRETRVRDFWNTHSTDYANMEAAREQFVDYVKIASTVDEATALASLDMLFDKMKEDEVAYYTYTRWMNGIFYHPLSPYRSVAFYAKLVDRLSSDGIFLEEECIPYRQQLAWLKLNLAGDRATLPGVDLDERRTLILVLDLGCPSCREALTALSAAPEWADVRRVAIGCGHGPEPDIPGWDYYFPEDAAAVFDPEITPVYFVVSADGTVEKSYTPAL